MDEEPVELLPVPEPLPPAAAVGVPVAMPAAGVWVVEAVLLPVLEPLIEDEVKVAPFRMTP